MPHDTQGVVIGEAVPGGPTRTAGIQSAVDTDGDGIPEVVDIITAINDEPLSNLNELIGYLAAETEPSDTVTLSVLRLTGDTSEELQLGTTLTPRP